METTQKPRLAQSQLNWTLIDWFYEVGGWIILLVLWAYIIIQFSKLPDRIPTHFGLSGLPDGFSSRNTIFVLPAIVTIMYALISIINRFPHLYKYNVTITPLNAKSNYNSITRRVRILKFLLTILFCFFWYKSIRVALNQSEGLGKWFLPLALILFLGAIFIILTGSIRQMHSGENS